MALDRLKQVVQHVSSSPPPPHPFDPLTASEIEAAVAIIRKEHTSLFYNAVTLHEPRKAAMLAWLADPEHTHKPHRIADVVAIGKGSKVFDGLVDLHEQKILQWESMDGVQPLVRCNALSVEAPPTHCFADHNGGSTDSRACRTRESRSHRTVRYHWNPKGRHAQSLLRS